MCLCRHSVIPSLFLCLPENIIAGLPLWPRRGATVPPSAASTGRTTEEPSRLLLCGIPSVRPFVAHASPSSTRARPAQATGCIAGKVVGTRRKRHLKERYAIGNPSSLYLHGITCLSLVWICDVWGFQRAARQTDLHGWGGRGSAEGVGPSGFTRP